MIFIADLQDNQQIDFTEFKQVVVNWSDKPAHTHLVV